MFSFKMLINVLSKILDKLLIYKIYTYIRVYCIYKLIYKM